MPNMKTIDDYMERVLMVLAAPFICGRSCVVKFQNPPTVGSYGSTMVRTDGMIEIHISPFLEENTIKTYLHELAHVRLGHVDLMPRSNIHEAKQRSIHQNKTEVRTDWETDADELMEKWLRYGEAHAQPNQTQTQNVIWALLDFYKDGKHEKD